MATRNKPLQTALMSFLNEYSFGELTPVILPEAVQSVAYCQLQRSYNV